LSRVTASEGDTLQALSVIALITTPDELPTSVSTEPALISISKPSPVPDATPVVGAKPVPAQKPAPGKRTFISPRARRLAEERGVAIEKMSATGPEGAIVERDVRAHLQKQAAPAAAKADIYPSSQPGASPFNEILTEMPLKGVRAIIAERMAESTSTAARVTLTAEADAGALVALRRQLAEDGVQVSYNDLLIYILGRVLKEQPALNASMVGEILRQWKRVHIGLAVDTERGLLVPVVRDADSKGLAQLAKETNQLIERARDGKLKPDELQGGTFTLTNLGMFGIDVFTPIINLPETAILGVGRIKARPAVRDGEIVIRETAWLSLAFDHRVVDGAPAARFLQRVVQLIEHPHLMHT
jgi:pyruvate dehydrogenase E2 component (dihydrolipoamide acetyltransferase)